MTGEERYIGVFFEEVETRTDYTFKYNTHIGRHGWLRLTPAYSVKLVRELIKKDCKEKSLILDPFSGTATTGLVAAEMGFDATLFDINPFLIWLGNTKCHHFLDDKNIKISAIRKRNTKKGLIEFNVKACWA